jgi:T5SS/PEP-CTERM-associated repeat protein
MSQPVPQLNSGLQICVTSLRSSLLLLAASLFFSTLQAQFVNDGASRTMSNETNFYDGDITIGTNGSFTLLTLSNNALLTNSGHGNIGLNATASSNEVRLINPSARWLIGESCVVGSNGTFNRLIISNGAMASSDYTIIGHDAGANNNAVIVTGTNSLWKYGTFLRVGNSGSFNQLVVSEGATISNSGADLGFSSVATNNAVLVTGPGSLWDSVSGTIVRVGRSGSFNQVVVSNGATLIVGTTFLGVNFGSTNNAIVVTGAGSFWSNRLDLRVGDSAGFNTLTISDGAGFYSQIGDIGYNMQATNNAVLVTGFNSVWTSANGTAVRVGRDGAFNQLTISNGATVINSVGIIGVSVTSSNNSVLVFGSGSVWSNRATLTVGSFGPANQLAIVNPATVFAKDGVIVGATPSSTANLVTVNGGILVTTNPASSGALDVRRGTNRLELGLIDVDQLLLTNAQGMFEFKGGMVQTKATTNDNGQSFIVGNRDRAAKLKLLGGFHVFSNNLTIVSNAALSGDGTIAGIVTVEAGGTLSPGDSIGTLVFNDSPVLQGLTSLEISKIGTAITNDQVQVSGSLNYGGTLIVSNVGPTALVAGDKFQLFVATNYGGGLTAVSLPLLDSGLDWTNKLLVDGSIEVVSVVVSQPKFSSITVSGTNVIVSGTNGSAGANYTVLTATNLTTPLSHWMSLVTNQFGAGGSFSFIHAIEPSERERYFRILIP